MSKKVSFLIFTLIILLVIFQKPVSYHIKAIGLLSQELPQARIKPLHWVTKEPQHEIVEFQNLAGNKVVADIFYPRSSQVYPAVIIAMGVKTAEKDKPLILGFAETLARLGYVVIWPRLEILENGKSRFEEPETFITAFEYLEDPERSRRVSFIGFSVGSSIALVAAENPEIAQKVNAIVFFGGYYDIFDYLEAIKNPTDWQPAEGAVNHVKEIVQETRLRLDFGGQAGLDKETVEILEKFNPAKNIDEFNAKIFILHERGDTYVPYTESQKLNQALIERGKRPEAFHIANLFEHVQPKKEITTQTIQELLKLYLFVVRVFESL